MPIANMEDDPRYGIVGPAAIPTVDLGGSSLVRVIAGPLGDVVGPAEFGVTVQILDVELAPNAEWAYTCPEGMDNVVFYSFKGSGLINQEAKIKAQQIVRFDTSGPQSTILRAGPNGYRGMVLTGKMTKERLIWDGPFVGSSKANLEQCFANYQTGKFPPKKVPWNYRDIRAKPK